MYSIKKQNINQASISNNFESCMFICACTHIAVCAYLCVSGVSRLGASITATQQSAQQCV